LRRAALLAPDEASFRYYLARAYFENGDLSRTLEALDATLALDDTYAEAYALKARVDVQIGAVRDAIAGAKKALKLDERLYAAYASMGDAYAQLGRARDAIAAYEKAVAHRPANGRYWYRLGRLRLDAGQRDRALEAL